MREEIGVVALLSAPLLGLGLLALAADRGERREGRIPRRTPPLRPYVLRMLPLAREIEAAGGPPAVFGLAHGAVESANGGSGLTARHRNHFGIKAGGGWAGSRVTLPTREVIDGRDVVVNAAFRAYPSDADGWRDWSTVARRLAKKGGLPAGSRDPKAWADAVAKGGWATDPRYAATIRRRIDLVESVLATSDAVAGPRRLSAVEIARLARGAGFDGRSLITMTAVGLAESDGDPTAIRAGNVGIWQIAADVHKIPARRLMDPVENALAARNIWVWARKNRPTPYQPWGAYNDGRYEARLAEAERAVRELPA